MVLTAGGEGSLHQVGVQVVVVRELLRGQVVLAGLAGGHPHDGLVGEQSVPLGVPPVQPDIVRLSHIRRIDPVQFESPFVAGSIPVNLGQAVDC